MHQKYDSDLKSTVTTIYAGEYYITCEDEIISTVLGSCIAVCLYDENNYIAGMNHFMLPEHESENIKKRGSFFFDGSLRYGFYSMEAFINEMIKMGTNRNVLRAKVFGGGNVLSYNSEMLSVGEKNISFIKSYLQKESIKVMTSDMGKNYGRKLYYLTRTRSVFLKRILEASS